MSMVYLWAWLLWALATCVVIACGLRMTAWVRPWFLRDLIRMLAIATLVAPVEAGPSEGFLAPAYIVLIFEGLLQRDGDPVPALAALTIAWALGVVVAVAMWIWRRVRRGPQRQEEGLSPR